MHTFWVAILVVFAGQGGESAPVPSKEQRPAVCEATSPQPQRPLRSCALGRHSGRRPFASALNLTELDAYEVEDDDDVESRMIDLVLLGLCQADRLAGVLPCSSGSTGRLPDPNPDVPFRLRC
jgi:hypothetical protein